MVRPLSAHTLSDRLLAWFDRYGRDLPWRVKGGAHSDPYAVWISEIMLQQTTVKTVLDYFPRWMNRFPNVQALAAADVQDVLLMWQGLGYYTRARKLHECARVLADQYNGRIPADRNTLLKLPGIGPYTASSICCFAFNMPETVVDGNVIRVIARLYGLTQVITRDDIYRRAQPLTPADRGADYASAIMDLGATICLPEHPKCETCPWQPTCLACARRIAEQIPVRPKPMKQERRGTVWLIQNNAGAYAIRQRGGRGLLSGLYEFPWSYADETPLYTTIAGSEVGQVVHTFTHFRLTLTVRTCRTETLPAPDMIFVPPDRFNQYPFSTLMRKVIHYTSPIHHPGR